MERVRVRENSCHNEKPVASNNMRNIYANKKFMSKGKITVALFQNL